METPMPSTRLIRPAVVLVLSAASAAAFAAVPPPKTGNAGNAGNANKGKAKEPAEKLEPVVIRFESAQKQRVGGTEVMVLSGLDPVSGRPRQFPVENRPPQDKSKLAKYDPNPRVADAVKDAKPGDLIKVDLKAGTGYNANTVWAEKADKYDPAEHEDEPNTFVFYESFKDTVDGVDVYKVTLTKFGTFYNCLAPMVPAEDGKGKVPDPQVMAAADGIKRKSVIEATVAPQGSGYVVTSLDAYQAPKPGKFTKLADADVNGQKGQAVELQEDGQTKTLLVPGKTLNKKWVSDAAVLAEARKVKPGMAVLFRTREVDGKTYVRQIVAAPKEPTKVAAKGGSETMAKPEKDAAADKKDAKKK
jgi:hypothetical protein